MQEKIKLTKKKSNEKTRKRRNNIFEAFVIIYYCNKIKTAFIKKIIIVLT